MHLFGCEARGNEPQLSRAATAGRVGKGKEKKETRRGGEDKEGGRAVKAVAGISSPARQLITQRPTA